MAKQGSLKVPRVAVPGTVAKQSAKPVRRPNVPAKTKKAGKGIY